MLLLKRSATIVCTVILGGVISSILATTAWGFSEGGHKVIASVAFQRLSPADRATLVAILQSHPRFRSDFRNSMPAGILNGPIEDRQEWIFQQAAIWPDLARDFSGAAKTRFHRGNWHFINQPFFLTDDDEEALSDSIDVNLNVEPPSTNLDDSRMNVVQAIANSVRIIESRTQLNSTKAVHICWLLHCVGDLHQPLHSSAMFSRRLFPQGDRGGNSIKTTVDDNLHAVWDRTFGTKLSLPAARDLAASLRARADLQRKMEAASQSLDPRVMWSESIEMAREIAYSHEVIELLKSREADRVNLEQEPIPLSNDYLAARKGASEVAMVRAGARLSAILALLANPGSTPHHELAGIHSLDTSSRLAVRVGAGAESLGNVEATATIEPSAEEQIGLLPLDAPARQRTASGAACPADCPHCAKTAVAVKTDRFPSFDPMFPPPEGAKTFELSQQYPETYDTDEQFPWSEIDYRVNPTGYLNAVLGYCLAGNTETDFRGSDNPIRKWYHAPWMHDDGEKNPSRRAGREYHHGLTSERRSRPLELHPLQTGEGFPENRIQNWAVSLYSARGGYTLGKIWRTADGIPDPTRATFPDNTVSFKLLFTAAPVAQVPFLTGSLEWTANIHPPMPLTPYRRADQQVRLLQVDVAVKDPRVAKSTGWIFGTFVYDGFRPGEDKFKKLIPVGLSWGDDSNEPRLIEKQGSYINPHLRQTVLNHELLEPEGLREWGEHTYVRHHGLGGRLNGPVDNPSSSCISCHGRAAVTRERPLVTMPNVYKSGSVPEQIAAFDRFFRSVRPNSQLVRAEKIDGSMADFVTVDYSLQVSMGIRNFHTVNPDAIEKRRKGEAPCVTRGAE
ncbi:MAG: S1/P1 nuclease [Pirellulales bacterium]